MEEDEEYSESRQLTADELYVKREINDELWIEIKKKLEGSPEEVKEAIRLFFENYKHIPYEADDLICQYTQPDQPYEYRFLIASYFAKTEVTLKLHNDLLNILEKDDDDEIQRLIADKLEHRRKINEQITEKITPFILRMEKTAQVAKQYTSMIDEKVIAAALAAKQYASMIDEKVIAAALAAKQYASMIDKKLIAAAQAAQKLRDLNLPLQLARNFQMYQQIYYSMSIPLSDLTKSLFTSYYSPSNISHLEVPETAQEELSIQLIDKLFNCPKGREGWRQYEDICEEILKYLFVPPLGEPIPQSRTESGFHRRDFVLQIPYHVKGFWAFRKIKNNSTGLVVECKNYTGQIMEKDVNETAKYLRKKRLGNFGLIFCRENSSDSAIKAVERHWDDHDKLIIILTDNDLIDMIKLKENGDEPEQIIEKKFFDLMRTLD